MTAAGARIDAVYACPHMPVEPLLFGRKPDPGMLTAAAELNLDLTASWIAGDCATDIEAGRRAGLRGGWLVPIGFGARDGFEVVVGEPLDRLADRLDAHG